MNRYCKKNSLKLFNYYIKILFVILFNYRLILICYGKECGTIDVRNRPSSLEQLRNCTVIKGHLQIVLIQGNDKIVYSDKDYENYRFPKLREITEFLIFFDVAGLTSLGKLLPNLTVIRGKRLFLNYALAIDSMPDLRVIDFKSLISIQRGSVYINRNPNLCYLEYINWNELTENMIGINFYKSMQPNNCLAVRGCELNNYWSYSYCQKFRSDNTISTIKVSDCHSQCLGGCYNLTNANCAVCKTITDGVYCVDKCPSNKYFAEDHLRCYTEQKCIEMGRYLFNNECIRECPSGYSVSKTNKTDYRCYKCDECKKICQMNDEIQYISNAEILKGCTIIKGNLSIRIMSKIDEIYLENVLGDIVEIQDFLKIYRTPSITSLNFLKNLRIIYGESLELNHYALIIYENKNLKKLWNWNTFNVTEKNITIKNGGIFLYSNYKLCTNEIIELHKYVKHNDSMNTIQENDEEVLCNPIRLDVNVTVESHESVILVWPESESAYKTQLLYKKLKNNSNTSKFDDEYNDQICYRGKWTKEILLHADLISISANNNTNNNWWWYKLSNLEQNTWYALVIKTYGNNYNSSNHNTVKNLFSSQSKVIRFKTKPDIPSAPQLYTLMKTSDSITLTWETIMENDEQQQHQLIEYYLVDVYVQADDQNIIDTRDYCSDPLKQTSSSVLNGKIIDDQYDNSDTISSSNSNIMSNGSRNIIENNNQLNLLNNYENCCNRIENIIEDREFISLIDSKFRCSQSNNNYDNSCKIIKFNNIDQSKLKLNSDTTTSHTNIIFRSQELIPEQYNSEHLIKSEIINSTEKFYKITNLTYYTLYIFQFFACNHIGCSAYKLHSDRTSPLLSADNISLQIKKSRHFNNSGGSSGNSGNIGNNDHNEYLLYFREPKKPNGATVAFTIEYRTIQNSNNSSSSSGSSSSNYSNNFTGSIKCITRLQHEKNSYIYPIYIDHKNFWARVKSISLAGPGIPTDWIQYKYTEDDIMKNTKNNNHNTFTTDNYRSDDLNDGNSSIDGFVIFCIISLLSLTFVLGWMIYRKFIYNRSFNVLQNLANDEQILMQDFDRNYLDDSTEEINL